LWFIQVRETLINSVRGERSRTMNTEFNKISMLYVTSFDFASFDFAQDERN